MAVLSKDDFMKKIKERCGDDTSDDTLAFISDMSDTYNDMESKCNDTTNWKEKYEQNDADWRKKYRDRFFEGNGEEPDYNQQSNPDADKPKTFEDLFKKEEK